MDFLKVLINGNIITILTKFIINKIQFLTILVYSLYKYK